MPVSSKISRSEGVHVPSVLIFICCCGAQASRPAMPVSTRPPSENSGTITQPESTPEVSDRREPPAAAKLMISLNIMQEETERRGGTIFNVLSTAANNNIKVGFLPYLFYPTATRRGGWRREERAAGTAEQIRSKVRLRQTVKKGVFQETEGAEIRPEGVGKERLHGNKTPRCRRHRSKNGGEGEIRTLGTCVHTRSRRAP